MCLSYVQWEKLIIIEAVEIRLEQFVLDDTVFLQLQRNYSIDLDSEVVTL